MALHRFLCLGVSAYPLTEHFLKDCHADCIQTQTTGKIGKSPQFYILHFPCPLRSQHLQEQRWHPLMTQVEYAKSSRKVTLTDTVHGIATERQHCFHTIWPWAKFLRYNCHFQKLFKKVLPILAYPHVSLYACSLPISGDFGMEYNMFSWFLYVLLGPCCWNKEAQKCSGSKTDANFLLFHSRWSLAAGSSTSSLVRNPAYSFISGMLLVSTDLRLVYQHHDPTPALGK